MSDFHELSAMTIAIMTKKVFKYYTLGVMDIERLIFVVAF